MNDEIIEVMERSEQPIMTLKEIVAELDVSKKTVYNRLEELQESGEVEKKKVGARAAVWWLPDRYPPRAENA